MISRKLCTSLYEVEVYARPVGATDSSTDVLVDTLTNQKVGNLRAGRSKTINAKFTLPAGLATDNYNFVAVIDTANSMTETNAAGTGETNNDVTTAASVAVTVAAAKLPPATFTYRTRGAFGILELTSRINPKKTIKLSFSTATTGSYRATVAGGSFQVGGFV